jgi:hypothetical protein
MVYTAKKRNHKNSTFKHRKVVGGGVSDLTDLRAQLFLYAGQNDFGKFINAYQYYKERQITGEEKWGTTRNLFGTPVKTRFDKTYIDAARCCLFSVDPIIVKVGRFWNSKADKTTKETDGIDGRTLAHIAAIHGNLQLLKFLEAEYNELMKSTDFVPRLPDHFNDKSPPLKGDVILYPSNIPQEDKFKDINSTPLPRYPTFQIFLKELNQYGYSAFQELYTMGRVGDKNYEVKKNYTILPRNRRNLHEIEEWFLEKGIAKPNFKLFDGCDIVSSDLQNKLLGASGASAGASALASPGASAGASVASAGATSFTTNNFKKDKDILSEFVDSAAAAASASASASAGASAGASANHPFISNISGTSECQKAINEMIKRANDQVNIFNSDQVNPDYYCSAIDALQDLKTVYSQIEQKNKPFDEINKLIENRDISNMDRNLLKENRGIFSFMNLGEKEVEYRYEYDSSIPSDVPSAVVGTGSSTNTSITSSYKPGSTSLHNTVDPIERIKTQYSEIPTDIANSSDIVHILIGNDTSYTLTYNGTTYKIDNLQLKIGTGVNTPDEIAQAISSNIGQLIIDTITSTAAEEEEEEDEYEDDSASTSATSSSTAPAPPPPAAAPPPTTSATSSSTAPASSITIEDGKIYFISFGIFDYCLDLRTSGTPTSP